VEWLLFQQAEQQAEQYLDEKQVFERVVLLNNNEYR